jgi:hypothetical protein
MAAERANDLQAFKSFINEQLSNGETVPTVDEVLACWEYENEGEDEREEIASAPWQCPLPLLINDR